MTLGKEHSPVKVLVRVAMDMGWIGLAYLCALVITQPGGQSLGEWAWEHAAYGAFFAAVWCAVATDQGLFASRRSETLVAVIFSMAKSFFITLVLSAFFVALTRRAGVDREFFLLFSFLALGAALAFTLAARPSMWNLRRRGYNFRRILIVGANNRTAHLVDMLLANEQYGFHIIGFLEDDEERRAMLETYGVKCLGAIVDLEQILLDRVIDGVYISLPVRSYYETILNIAHLCEGVGVPVRLLADLFPLRMASSEVTYLRDLPLLSLSVSPEVWTRFALRRALDFVTALLLLLVLIPILAIVALWVKLDSRGPVFAFKTMADPFGRTVRLLGFRVRVRCDAQGGEPGVFTRAGRWLRRYGLDELPQLFNVLLGQASLAGARPLRALSKEAPPVAPKEAPARRKRTQAPDTQYLLGLGALALLDACCIGAAFFFAARVTSPSRLVLPYTLVNYLPYFLVFVLIWFGAAIDERLWTIRPRETLSEYLSAVGKAVGDAAVFCVFLVVLFSPEDVPRRFLVAFCMGTLGLLMASRVGLRIAVSELHRRGHYVRRGVIIGANERTGKLVEALSFSTQHSCRLDGLVDDDPARGKGVCERFGLPYLGQTETVGRVLEESALADVYVSLPVRSFYEAIQDLAERCETAGVAVHLLADLFPVRIARSRVMQIEDIPLVSLSPISEAHGKLALKRLLDAVCSTLLLLGCLPLFAILAILIKLDSQGPVFFSQERVGQNGRRFKMIKFRSMVVNAEELKKALEAQNEADGPVFKIKRDPRITRVGRFIRKFSLDELPQLFNVWWGEMSLVGPRPPLPNEVAKYTWSQRRRLSVKPGMTGLWQVSGRSDLGFDQWVSLDLSYIDTWSIVSDFVILLRTFKVVVTGRGAS